MNVLSLFDGISYGQIAFEKLGITFRERESNCYFASEIKNIAIKTTQMHYPDTIQLGDVTKLHYENNHLYKNCYIDENNNWILGEKIPNSKIDVLIGGSPCQNFSIMNMHNRKGLEGNKSKLFYEYLRLKEEINPKYFLLENVKMSKDNEKKLNNFMKIDGIHINSNLLSFQNRPRIYWTNIENITLPKNKNINFQSYKDSDIKRCEEAKVNVTPSRIRMWNNGKGRTNISSCDNITNSIKIGCLTRKQDRSPNSGLIEYKNFCRFLTRKELELAQTLPIGYCNNLSFNQVQDVTGDGWTVDVIAHILSFIPEIKQYKIKGE